VGRTMFFQNVLLFSEGSAWGRVNCGVQKKCYKLEKMNAMKKKTAQRDEEKRTFYGDRVSGKTPRKKIRDRTQSGTVAKGTAKKGRSNRKGRSGGISRSAGLNLCMTERHKSQKGRERFSPFKKKGGEPIGAPRYKFER